jgi:hypothetical protein
MAPPPRPILAAGVLTLLVAVMVTGCSGASGHPTAASTTSRPASSSVTGAPAASTTTPPASATPPAPGTTVLASLPTDGRVNLLSNGTGFTVVESLTNGDTDDSQVTSYDAAGHKLTTIGPGRLTGECGAADISPGGRRLLVTAQTATQQAQGINAAQYSLTLTAWDATTGAQVWQAPVVPPQPDPSILRCSAFDGVLLHRNADPPLLAITDDDAWGVLTAVGTDLATSEVLDMTNGHLTPRTDALGTVGNFVVIGDNQADPPQLHVTLPPSWTPLGELAVPGSPSDYRFPDVATNAVLGPYQAASTYVQASDDGTQLFIRNDSGITAYALPAMRQIWAQQPPNGLVTYAEAGGVLVAGSYANNNRTTTGLDTATGAQKWSLPDLTVCGITRTQMQVLANGQLAIIDLATGKQLSYRPDPYQSIDGPSCPQMLGDGLEVVADAGPIVQRLTP